MGQATLESKPMGLAKMSADNVTLAIDLVNNLDLIHCNIFGGDLIKQDEPVISSVQDTIAITADKLRYANEIARAIISKMKGGN